MESTNTESKRALNKNVIEELNQIASEFRQSGLELFLFGSLAESFPFARRGADIDVGMYAAPGLSQDSQALLKSSARARLDSLPTIRPVDVVDFDLASERFKAVALSSRLNFPL